MEQNQNCLQKNMTYQIKQARENETQKDEINFQQHKVATPVIRKNEAIFEETEYIFWGYLDKNLSSIKSIIVLVPETKEKLNSKMTSSKVTFAMRYWYMRLGQPNIGLILIPKVMKNSVSETN